MTSKKKNIIYIKKNKIIILMKVTIQEKKNWKYKEITQNRIQENYSIGQTLKITMRIFLKRHNKI